MKKFSALKDVRKISVVGRLRRVTSSRVTNEVWMYCTSHVDISLWSLDRLLTSTFRAYFTFRAERLMIRRNRRRFFSPPTDFFFSSGFLGTRPSTFSRSVLIVLATR